MIDEDTSPEPIRKAEKVLTKLKLDRPRNLAEAETLAILKFEVQNWTTLKDTDDYFLLRFLRARHLDLGKTKETIKKYFEFRDTNKRFLEVCKSSYVPSKIVLSQFAPFVRTFDYDGRLAIIGKPGQFPVRELFEMAGHQEVLRLGHYCLEYWFQYSEQQRKKIGCGKLIGVCDFDGLESRNVFFPHSVRIAIYLARIAESYYPELLQHALVINANWVCHLGYKILKPFLSEATLEKMQIYGHDERTWKHVLEKYIPNAHIPAEYGGTAKNLEMSPVDIFDGFRVQQQHSSQAVTLHHVQ